MSDKERSMRDRMLAGELYVADDPVLAEEPQRAMALMEAINRSSAADPALRRRLFTELLIVCPGVTVGKNTVVGAV